MKSWEVAVNDALQENDYLNGDDCEASENWLVGWSWAVFKRLEHRVPNAQEAGDIRLKIRDFLGRSRG